MKILVVGSGGREHALAWKLVQEGHQVFATPGNGGMQQIATCENIGVNDFESIKDFIEQQRIELTVVGPEEPLCKGIVDYLAEHGHAVFGPTKAGAILEGSKVQAREFMNKHHIPTPKFEICTEPAQARKLAHRFLQQFGGVAIKADGLAAGKGVKVCKTPAEAETAIDEIMEKKVFGKSGELVLIEEMVTGEEISVLAFVDGNHILPLLPSQDHKRAYDNDEGPNTGGMGAYAPVPFVTQEITEAIHETIIKRTLQGTQDEGLEYKGVLYFGLILTPSGPCVLEYNCRFGDPEIQPLLLLFKSNLAEMMMRCLEGNLAGAQLEWTGHHACCVVLASGGYPLAYEKGKVIHGLDKVTQCVVFHAGTKKDNGQFLTSGGRVVGVTGTGKTLKQAIENTYACVGHLHFDKMEYRKDIGRRWA